MEITKVEAIPFHLGKGVSTVRDRRTVVPLSWALWGDKVLVKVSTDEGLVGLGVSDPIPREWGVDARVIAYYINTYYGPTILGLDPCDVELIWKRMDDLFEFTQIPQVNAFQRQGIDIALYDLIGKYCRVPVNKIMGGRYRDRVPVAAVVYLYSPEKVAKDAANYVSQGFKEVKLKVGAEDPDVDVQNVKAIREAVGDEISIRVDANGAWNVNKAIRVIKRLERYDIAVVEQPVLRWDVKGMAEVRKRVDTPIMADESLHSIYDAQRLIEARACDVFNIKLCKTAGLTVCKKITAIAESAGITCFMGSEGETGIGIAAALHLISSSPNFGYCADFGLRFQERWRRELEIIKEPFEQKDGEVEVPNKPGLGVELDEEKFNQWVIKQAPSLT